MFRLTPGSSQRRQRVRAWGLVLAVSLAWPWVSVGGAGTPGVSGSAASATAREPPAAVTPALRGTILSARSAEARVIITDGSGHEKLYARGDEISPGATIVEIQQTYVVLQRNGRLEKLDFSRRLAEPITASGASTVTGGASSNDESDSLRAEMFTNPGLLLQLVGASTAFEGGRFVGFRVMTPQDPAFLESLGLKPGDILTGVNGMSVSNTPDYGAKVFESVSGADALTYTVQRGTQILFLTR